MDDLRRITVGAVGLSFTLVFVLLLFVMNTVEQPEAEVSRLVSFVSILVLTYATIFQWIRCARKYIDHAIDRRLALGEK